MPRSDGLTKQKQKSPPLFSSPHQQTRRPDPGAAFVLRRYAARPRVIILRPAQVLHLSISRFPDLTTNPSGDNRDPGRDQGHAFNELFQEDCV